MSVGTETGGSRFRRSKTKKGSPSTMRAGADLILDSALKAGVQDRFEHKAIAQVVANLAVDATPPVNIALFGPWGSGKSSFFGLLEERIRDSREPVKVARYDAWKYGGRALKKHFVGSVAEQIGLGGEDFEQGLAHDRETLQLDLWGWVKTNWRSLLLGLGLAVFIAFVWFVLVSAASLAVNQDGLGTATKFAVTSVGTALSLSFAALLIGPKVLESAVVKVTEAAPETDDEFAKSFQTLVTGAINVGKGERLVVFIDELDRCSPEDVVATLIDLKTFLDVEGCVFVVAADREVLERALRKVPQANPVRDEDPYYSTPGAFLDKIFQHQIPLPPLRPQALTRFARGLVEKQDGLWADLRAAEPDERLFLKVVYALIPVHVRSPRRVKVLLNNYATNVRVAEARGIGWLERATELACLTVLETEFPAVAADLVRIPRLLAFLRGEEMTSGSKEVQRVVHGYRLTEADTAEVPEDAQAAGALLVDATTDASASDRANKVLNAHLLSYLRKVAAQGIADPRPDLFYLQSAGFNEGITDPDLGYAIDYAAELAADDVVQAFASQPSPTVATGVRLLVQQAEAERGPGRTTIIEAACRLVENLDRHDLEAVAPVAAGGVLADVDSPDWSREATPGALLLGVIGARADLVDRLLERDSADDLARDGLLARVSPVLAYSSSEQAELVHGLLASAYRHYPQPLHEALTRVDLAAALSLWRSSRTSIEEALAELPAPPETATPTAVAATAARTATSHAATQSATAEPASAEAAGERYGALLTAAEARTDDAGALISEILEFGQTSALAAVRKTVRAREDDALTRIEDPQRLTRHAFIGIERAPLNDCKWWSDYVKEGPSDSALAFRALQRLTIELPDADEEDVARISETTPELLPHLSADDSEDIVLVIGRALNTIAWPSNEKIDSARRGVAYGITQSAHTLVGEEAVNKMLADDILRGFDESAASADFLEEGLKRVGSFNANAAALVEAGASDREATGSGLVAILRLRVAAAAITQTNPLKAADVLSVQGVEGASPLLNAWLRLGPPLAEVQQVLGRITVDVSALGSYAKSLAIEDRTKLWIDIEQREGNWSLTAFKQVGAAGIGSPAIEHIGQAVKQSPQQSQRDDLVNRLLAARLTEQPAHRAATDLVEQLLDTQVNGDAALAARIAIASGGAAYGRTVAIRNKFDEVVAAKPKAISKNDQEKLRAISLLTRPKKKSGVRGVIEGLMGGGNE